LNTFIQRCKEVILKSKQFIYISFDVRGLWITQVKH